MEGRKAGKARSKRGERSIRVERRSGDGWMDTYEVEIQQNRKERCVEVTLNMNHVQYLSKKAQDRGNILPIGWESHHL